LSGHADDALVADRQGFKHCLAFDMAFEALRRVSRRKSVVTLSTMTATSSESPRSLGQPAAWISPAGTADHHG